MRKFRRRQKSDREKKIEKEQRERELISESRSSGVVDVSWSPIAIGDESVTKFFTDGQGVCDYCGGVANIVGGSYAGVEFEPDAVKINFESGKGSVIVHLDCGDLWQRKMCS